MNSPYKIHFPGNMYCFELYNKQGKNIYTLAEAIAEAIRQYPNDQFEVYNGEQGYTQSKKVKHNDL